MATTPNAMRAAMSTAVTKLGTGRGEVTESCISDAVQRTGQTGPTLRRFSPVALLASCRAAPCGKGSQKARNVRSVDLNCRERRRARYAGLDESSRSAALSRAHRESDPEGTSGQVQEFLSRI